MATTQDASRRTTPLLPLAVVLFALGLLAVGAVFVLFATGHQNLPVWLNLACTLAPIGLAVGVAGAVRDGRAATRARRD